MLCTLSCVIVHTVTSGTCSTGKKVIKNGIRTALGPSSDTVSDIFTLFVTSEQFISVAWTFLSMVRTTNCPVTLSNFFKLIVVTPYSLWNRFDLYYLHPFIFVIFNECSPLVVPVGYVSSSFNVLFFLASLVLISFLMVSSFRLPRYLNDLISLDIDSPQFWVLITKDFSSACSIKIKSMLNERYSNSTSLP